jgi:ATP-dependent helicase/DNAse subunit B
MSDNDTPNRAERRRMAAEARERGELGTTAFLKLADKFIDVANRENRNVSATELHMAFLYAAARYNAHVAKVVLDVQNHEAFVADMTKSYQEMLRQNLADPSLAPPKEPT